jgi:DNA-binding XRE family transcriptional regulator
MVMSDLDNFIDSQEAQAREEDAILKMEAAELVNAAMQTVQTVESFIENQADVDEAEALELMLEGENA